MIEVLKQALEALESCGEGHITDGGNQWYDAKLVDTAIASLRQAIREHAMYEVQRLGQEIEQQPVAMEIIYETIIQWDESGGKRSRRELARRIIDLYTHPPQRTEQNFCPRCGKRTNDIHTCTPPQGIYYTPPQRTWVGLEWNDMVDVLNEANGKSMELWEMFKALEAKIKERNT